MKIPPQILYVIKKVLFMSKSLNMTITDMHAALKTFYHLLTNDVILFYNDVYTHW